tara:strand:- start:244 stop:1539 length:1296 start_codon:yes stop_codon:yes gene_type:complete
MQTLVSADRLRFLIHRLRERLWVKPLVVCLLSVGAAFVARLADDAGLAKFVPEISLDSIETLLSIMASSMLVIATFSVASMVSAYASASSTATPRSFGLVVADDVSQNALSTFVGAFIFSIVALMAAKNAYFEKAGIFVLFALTAFVFGIVIFTFVRWVDSVARLGRIGSTIDKVEKATSDALKLRQKIPYLCGMPIKTTQVHEGQPVYATRIGYVQHIDMATIQVWAEESDLQVEIASLPGTLATPDRALAYVRQPSSDRADTDFGCINESFQIGNDRLFEDDPRFGLVVLSEIAGRALSPAVNDPGTAISVIGALLRIFIIWTRPITACEAEAPKYDRIAVPEISINDMFDDAFTAIARDGAGVVEVSVRLQKALGSLALTEHPEIRDAALYHGRLALKRASLALDIDEDLAIVREAANYTESVNNLPT